MIKLFKKSSRYQQTFSNRKIEGFSLFSSSAQFDSINQYFGDIYSFCDYHGFPGYGIPMHPHEHFTVISMIVEGRMHFQDQLGHDLIASRGDVHWFHAGKGYLHSVHNEGPGKCRFISIWLRQTLNKDEVSFHYQPGVFKELKDGTVKKLYPLAEEDCLSENEPVLHYGKVDSEKVVIACSPSSVGLLYIIKGSLLTNDLELNEGDHIRYEKIKSLELIPQEESEFVVVQMSNR